MDHLSENHAEWGGNILFKEILIRKFIEEDKYDRIIKLAILNHNKDKNDITKDITEREKLHIKLIRDSNKTDIIYLLTFEEKRAAWEKDDLSDEVFTDEIYREFIEDKNIFYPNMKTYADRLIGHFAFVYDFNYEYGLKIIYENKYYNKIYNRFKFNNNKTKEELKNIYNTTINYIIERLKKSNLEYKKTEEAFIQYSQKFDFNNENVKRKQLHSIRVMNICEKIAKEKMIKTKIKANEYIEKNIKDDKNWAKNY